MRRFKLFDAFNETIWREHIVERKVLAESAAVDASRRAGMNLQRLQLRRECESFIEWLKVQRLLAGAVARQQQTLPWSIPQCKCEHAVEAGQTADIPSLVCFEK